MITIFSLAYTYIQCTMEDSPNVGLEQCKKLHTLNLSWCTLTTMSGVGQCMHTLDLSHCLGLTDVSALGQCPSLRTLDLSVCNGLADPDVATLAAGANLEIIRMAPT